MLRRFERAGPPLAFWEIDYRTPREVVLRWGSEGRPVQSVRRTYATDIARARFVDEEIAKQLARGYVEADADNNSQLVAARELGIDRAESFVGPDRQYAEIVQQGRSVMWRGALARKPLLLPTVREASATFEEACRAVLADSSWRRPEAEPVVTRRRLALTGDPELEALCLQAPDDPGPWAVYADWLIAHQDPRGEIATLHAGGARAEAEALLRRDLDVLCGPEAAGKYAFEFRHGFVVGTTIKTGEQDDKLDELTRTFLASPLGRFVESLRFGLAGFSNANNWAPTLRVVCESAQASRIRELRFDAYIVEDSEISWTPFGDFSFAWPMLPALEHLHIRSGEGGTLGELVLPRLRTFIRESGGLASDEIRAICRAQWPALEHLEIWTGSRNYGAEGTIASLEPILSCRGLPRLVHLGLVNSELAEAVIEPLARSQLLPQLHSLDLSKGILAGRGVQELVANAAAFRHLASLDLRENLMTDEQCQLVRDALDNVIVTDQRDRGDYDEDSDDDDNDRYVAVGE